MKTAASLRRLAEARRRVAEKHRRLAELAAFEAATLEDAAKRMERGEGLHLPPNPGTRSKMQTQVAKRRGRPPKQDGPVTRAAAAAGVDFEELAKRLGVNHATLKSWNKRGRVANEKVREILSRPPYVAS